MNNPGRSVGRVSVVDDFTAHNLDIASKLCDVLCNVEEHRCDRLDAIKCIDDYILLLKNEIRSNANGKAYQPLLELCAEVRQKLTGGLC